MALVVLIGRYKEYKTKTKTFLYWLATTAESTARSTTASRTNTKAAPAAQSKPQRANGSTDPRESATRVSVAQLVKLAEAISEAVPAVTIPNGLLATVDDIIARREECNVWYSAQALEEDSQVAKENESHLHFISILRRIYDILNKVEENNKAKQAASKPKRQPSKGKKRAKPKPNPLENLFDNLDLHEPAVDPRVTLPNYLFRTQDLDDVRTYVRQLWDDYSNDIINSLTASLSTAVAFGLLRHADEEFRSPFGSTEWLMLIEYLGIGYFVRGNALWLHPDPNRKTRQPRMPDPSVDVVELLCPIAFQCLQSWQADVHAFCKHEQHSKKTGKAFELFGSDKHRFHPVCRAFYQLLDELHPLACYGADRLIDPFAHGLVEIYRTNVVPMWMVSACQILIDVDRIHGHGEFEGVYQLRDIFVLVKRTDAALQGYKKGNVRPLSDVSNAESNLRTLLEKVEAGEATIKVPSED